MDKAGHEQIRTIASEAGFHVMPMEPGKLAVRYVTAQVSGGKRPEDLLNLLDGAGLMSSDGPSDAFGSSTPQLEVVTSSIDWVTFEDTAMYGRTH